MLTRLPKKVSLYIGFFVFIVLNHIVLAFRVCFGVFAFPFERRFRYRTRLNAIPVRVQFILGRSEVWDSYYQARPQNLFLFLYLQLSISTEYIYYIGRTPWPSGLNEYFDGRRHGFESTGSQRDFFLEGGVTFLV